MMLTAAAVVTHIGATTDTPSCPAGYRGEIQPSNYNVQMSKLRGEIHHYSTHYLP